MGKTMNWFVLGCALLQFGGAIWYLRQGGVKLAMLYGLYALTNVVILTLRIE